MLRLHSFLGRSLGLHLLKRSNYAIIFSFSRGIRAELVQLPQQGAKLPIGLGT
jgi:hypothetical protein